MMIPKVMLGDDLSINFRFYDSTFAFVNENTSRVMKNFFTLRSKQNIKRSLDDQNIKGKVIELIGLEDSKQIKETKFAAPYLKRTLSTF